MDSISTSVGYLINCPGSPFDFLLIGAIGLGFGAVAVPTSISLVTVAGRGADERGERGEGGASDWPVWNTWNADRVVSTAAIAPTTAGFALTFSSELSSVVIVVTAVDSGCGTGVKSGTGVRAGAG